MLYKSGTESGEDLSVEAVWAEVLIPSMTRITSGIIHAAPDLKLIQQFGVGLEGIDIPSAARRGILVANVPGTQAPVHTECTAEGGLFLMMVCSRLFKASQQSIAKGEWGRPKGQALIDRSALILGLGAVGSALTRRLVALGMKVTGIDISPAEGLTEELGLTRVERADRLLSLLPEANFFVSAVTLTPKTRGMINRSVFSRMKPNAYFINISRGPVVNEEDLYSAVDNGIIAGAGLDVLSSEPPAPDNPLLNHDRIVITPHTAGVTEQSFTALGRAVADTIVHLKEGQPIQNTASA